MIIEAQFRQTCPCCDGPDYGLVPPDPKHYECEGQSVYVCNSCGARFWNRVGEWDVSVVIREPRMVARIPWREYYDALTNLAVRLFLPAGAWAKYTIHY